MKKRLPHRTLFRLIVPCSILLFAGCGDSNPSSTPGDRSGARVSWRSLTSENLAAASNCTACHTADEVTLARLGPATAPEILGDRGIGSRLSPAAIRTRIGAHGGEIGLRMPDLLHGLPEEEKAIATLELVHFLASQGGPLTPEDAMIEVATAEVTKGENLWNSIGCVACHGPDAGQGIGMQGLAAAWTRESLSAFLTDPLSVHPSGRMPSMNLSDVEASDLAAFLLTQPSTSMANPTATVAARPGLRLEMWNQAFDGLGPMDEKRRPDLEDRIPVPGVGPGAGRDDFGLRLSGEIEIPANGRWNFYLSSDDGSGLRIGDELVIDHGGVHSSGAKRGAVDLKAGRHPISISMFERSGGEELSLSWSGPGVARTPIPAAAFSADAAVLDPGWAPFEIDQKLADAGMERFARTGCAACHAPSLPRPRDMANLPPLGSLSAGAGCLAEVVPAGAPDYRFNDEERASLDDLVRNVASLEDPLPADLAVAHAMHRLDCIACHAREDVGGPTSEAMARFVSNDDAELGDEGRIPPALDDVGNKLRLTALQEIFEDGKKVRPYMQARMPVFGSEALGDLALDLAATDAINRDAKEPPFTPELAEIGHRLVGTDGVSCVQCHTAAGHPALGVPAVDLATMYERLRPGWFRKHLLDPQKTNPGTRMTAFWGNGGTDRILPDVLGGDPVKQVDAIRAYLALGESMPIPRGVVPDADEYALIPRDRPIVFGTFMEDVSPRTIAVGLPQNVHYAYDAEHGRLARMWRGEFMDARGTWHGRAGQLESPAGSSMVETPAGPAITVLENRAEPWPEAFSRDAAGVRNGPWRFAGRSTDTDGLPVFHSEVDGARISERPHPRLAAGGTRLVREFTVASDAGRGDLFARVAVASSIDPAGGEGRNRRWRTEDGTTLTISGADSFVREGVDGKFELLVKVPFRMSGREDAMFEGVFEIEMGW